MVRAMALASGKLLVAGPRDLAEKTDFDTVGVLDFKNQALAARSLKGEEGVLLRIITPNDGNIIFESELKSMPRFDGMSVAGGTVYISQVDGSVVALR